MLILRWIFALAVLSVLIPLIGTALYVATYRPRTDVPNADAIIVLAAGTIQARPPAVRSQTGLRIDRAVALFKEGKSPRLVMTGGNLRPPLGMQMKDEAIAAGVPEEAILVETASQSTLQNALFTADIESVDKSAPILLVTHRYHMPRAWASFRWAGFSNVKGVAADPTGGFSYVDDIFWESIKWPLNVARAAAASVAMAIGVPRSQYVRLLD